MPFSIALTPIFTTRGHLGGFIARPYLYTSNGDWMGWVSPDGQVYSVHGHWVGRLTAEPRILRKRECGDSQPRRQPPPMPARVRLPQRVPLPPMLAEIPTQMIDVLDEAPELLPCLDQGDLRDDMN